MEADGTLPTHRMKVAKNINKKAVLLKLSFNYFFAYIVAVLISLAILLGSFTGKTFFLAIIINLVSYMALQYLDRTDALVGLSLTKLPKSIFNDLYELKNERNPTIKKSPHNWS